MATRRQYGTTWWGAAWLSALERVDDANRLPRGKTYANQGHVEKLEFNAEACRIEALVSGSAYYPYEVEVGMKPIAERDAKRLAAAIAAEPDLVAALMDGELPKDLAELCEGLGIELFPKNWRSMKLRCSCPDSARVCKHIAAVFFVMADRIDMDPFFIFRFRGLDLKAEMKKLGVDVDHAVKVKPLEAAEVLESAADQLVEGSTLPLRVPASARAFSEAEAKSTLHALQNDPAVRALLTAAQKAEEDRAVDEAEALRTLRTLPYDALEPMGEVVVKMIPKTIALSNNTDCADFVRQILKRAGKAAEAALSKSFELEAERVDDAPLSPKAAWRAFAEKNMPEDASGRGRPIRAWEALSEETQDLARPVLRLGESGLSFDPVMALPAEGPQSSEDDAGSAKAAGRSKRPKKNHAPLDIENFACGLLEDLTLLDVQALAPEIECWREAAAAAAHILAVGGVVPMALSSSAVANPCPRIWWVPAMRDPAVRAVVDGLARGITPWVGRMVECDAALGPDGEIDPKRAAVLILSMLFAGFITRAAVTWKAFKGPGDVFEAAVICCDLDQLDGKMNASAGESLARVLKPFSLGDAYPWKPVLTVRTGKKDRFAVNFGILGRTADLALAAQNELSRPLSADDQTEDQALDLSAMPPSPPDDAALFFEADGSSGASVSARTPRKSAGKKSDAAPVVPVDRPLLLSAMLRDPVWADHRFAALTILKTISQAFPELDAIRRRKGKPASLPMEDLKEFLFDVAPHLAMLGITLMLPQAMRRLLRPRLVASASAGAGFGKSPLGRDAIADFNWMAAIGGKLLTKEAFLALADKAGQIVRIEDDFVYLDPEEIARIRRTIENPPAMTALERMRAVFAGEAEGAEIIVSDEVKEGLKRITEVVDVPAPAGLCAQLRPYQERGYSWLMKNMKLGLGSLIADDMGLGKTLQVISAVLELKNMGELKKKKVLAVLPTTLIPNWTRELAKFAPSVTVGVYHGAARDLPAEKDLPDVTLTSYGTLRRDFERLSSVKWRLLILDEAQAIKNPGTAQTAAVRGIKAQQVIAMTGTPVENHLMEFWSILSAVQPKILGSQKDFGNTFARPIEANHSEAAAEAFRRLTAPFMLRRLKTDKSIIADLPEKNTIDHFAVMHVEQAALYQKTLDLMLKKVEEAEKAENADTPEGRMARRGRVLKLITSLKQICNSPSQYMKTDAAHPDSGKGDALLEILSQCAEADRKVLVFTQYREMGERLQDWIEAATGERPDFLHGGVSMPERMRMVDRFQEDRTVKTFIVSLKAGGTGLNLTAASAVVHYDLWWNPAVEAQATDRAFRIGQRRDVLVYRFITAGSFEERINAMLEKKRDLADMTVATGESWIGDLSTGELNEIFGLKPAA